MEVSVTDDIWGKEEREKGPSKELGTLTHHVAERVRNTLQRGMQNGLTRPLVISAALALYPAAMVKTILLGTHRH